MSLSQCVESLVASDRRAEKEHKYRLSRIGRFVNSNYDEEMANVLRFTTHFVAEQIEPRYAKRLAKAESYSFEQNTEDDDEVNVHAFAYSVAGPVIPWCRIDERWTIPVTKLKHVKQLQYEEFVEYLGNDKEFDEILAFLLKQWRNARQKKKPSDAESEQTGPTANKNESGARDSAAECKDEDRDHGCAAASSREHVNAMASSNAFTGNLKVRIKPKTRKVGRPQKLKKATAASERTDRKWYKAAEAGRSKAGEDTLSALLESLDCEKPGLIETQRRLSGVLVKYAQANDKKPVYRKTRNPVLILDTFFILPSKLLDRCMNLLPISNTSLNPVLLDDDNGAPAHHGSVVEVI
ncbi:hypothetical protein PF006_g15015 [Phytophthora fragariae]|uniref:Uncharacterized protein n=1 Tax=Phytophthora fragariae TaxID=53985 RepID=A0A6A3TG59_9STRA|nr:hypothetical protein PF006_g15015 [Phytophthora fragariae]